MESSCYTYQMGNCLMFSPHAILKARVAYQDTGGGYAMSSTNNHLLEGEQADVHEELKTIVQDPDIWLNQPNDQLDGIRPKELLGSPEREKPLRDLLRAIKHGMPT
jgi:Protein of unknown function (DUF2384)